MLSGINDFHSEPSTDAEPAVQSRPLYASTFHSNIRIAYGSIGVCLLALAVHGVTFSRESIPWSVIARGLPVFLPMLMIAALLLRSNLRTCALYGSSEGLEIVRGGKRRLVPWSRVGPAKHAWWSRNYFARIAKVRIQEGEGKEQTYTFFANHQNLDDFEAMRALYARK